MALSRFMGAQDMTVGSPVKKLIQFSIPLLIGNLAQQLYNTVDSIVVGQYVGDNALAAVGASGPMINLLLVLFVGISTGAGVMTAQYFGAKRRQELSNTVGTTVVMTLLVSLAVMVAGPLLVPPFLRMVGTPAEIFEMTSSYMTIYFLGIAGMAYYNIIAGMLRGMGDSVMPLVFLMVACGLNIVLDIAFVAQFDMGVSGVALATIIAQFVSAFLCLRRLTRMKDVLDLNVHTLKPHMDLAKDLVKLGLPSGLSQAIFSMAAIVVQSLTNSFGAMIIAVNTVVMRVDGFAMMPNMSFGQAMSVYAGQNVGARKIDRVHEGLKQGAAIAVGCACAITFCLLLFGRYMFALFTDTQELIDLAMRMMQILAFGYIAIAVSQVLGGVMRGAGDTVTPMWISLFTTICLRVPLAYCLAWFTRCEAWPNGRPEALFFSLLIPWVLGAVISAVAYRRGGWRKALDQPL